MLELKLTFHNLNAVAMVTLEIAILFLFCVKNILSLSGLFYQCSNYYKQNNPTCYMPFVLKYFIFND